MLKRNPHRQANLG